MRHAALGASLAIGAALAALIEWWQTYAAFRRLPFPVTIESLAVVKAWTTAMTVAPLAVLVSALLLAMSYGGRTSVRPAGLKPGLHWPALVATLILAARVWENVSGYLAPPSSNADIEGTPLPQTGAPMPPIAAFAAVTLIAIGIAVFVLLRAKPRLVTLAIGVIASLALIVAGGHLGFAPIAFLRLRNWTFVVALLDAIAIIRFRKPRIEDVVAWALLAIVIVCAWMNATAWQTMRMSFPRDVLIPAW